MNTIKQVNQFYSKFYVLNKNHKQEILNHKVKLNMDSSLDYLRNISYNSKLGSRPFFG